MFGSWKLCLSSFALTYVLLRLAAIAECSTVCQWMRVSWSETTKYKAFANRTLGSWCANVAKDTIHRAKGVRTEPEELVVAGDPFNRNPPTPRLFTGVCHTKKYSKVLIMNIIIALWKDKHWWLMVVFDYHWELHWFSVIIRFLGIFSWFKKETTTVMISTSVTSVTSVG